MIDQPLFPQDKEPDATLKARRAVWILIVFCLCSLTLMTMAFRFRFGRKPPPGHSPPPAVETAPAPAATAPTDHAGARPEKAVEAWKLPRAGPQRVRPPAVAGSFYPANPEALRAEVDGFLKAVPARGLRGVRAVIVPHAGYVYSGATAGDGFREVDPNFDVAVILTANHSAEANYRGVSLPPWTHYEIGGVEVPVAAVVDEWLGRSDELFLSVPAAHNRHMEEVEIPFLQAIKGWPEKPDYTILPLVVSGLEEPDVKRLAERLGDLADPRTLFVVSTDLSHYLTDEKARQIDRATIESLMAKDAGALQPGQCCGHEAVQAVLTLAGQRGWETAWLGYRNSAAASGDKRRVVGYGAVAIHEPLVFSVAEEETLLRVARQTVETHVQDGASPAVDSSLYVTHPIFRISRGVFVTLHKQGQLRGCIGQLFPPQGTLLETVRECAFSAATRDGRFSPVEPAELPELTYSISVLDYPTRSDAAPADFARILRPGVDGVILLCGNRQSTFLPEVWEHFPNPEDFLTRLAEKGGSPGQAWREPEARLYTYRALHLPAQKRP